MSLQLSFHINNKFIGDTQWRIQDLTLGGRGLCQRGGGGEHH